MKKKSKRGFTLIEVLITVALVVVVAALMYTFFGQGISLYTMESESAQEQANLREVLSDITNRIRLADAGTVTVADNKLSIGSTVYAFDSTHNCVTRNGSTLVSDIQSFSVTLSDSLLKISLTSTAGTTLSTSLYVKG